MFIVRIIQKAKCVCELIVVKVTSHKQKIRGDEKKTVHLKSKLMSIGGDNAFYYADERVRLSRLECCCVVRFAHIVSY